MRTLSNKNYFQNLLFGVFGVAILSLGFAIYGQAPAKTLSKEEKFSVFERVWSLVNEKYYDPNFNGVKWEKIREQYRPQVAETAGDEEFFTLLDRMVGELRDSHTRVISPLRRQDGQNRRATSAGLTITEIENTFAVLSVAPESEAQRAGVRAGMRVLKIDEMPVGEIFAAVRDRIGVSSSERSTRLRIFSAMLSGKPDSLLKLTLAMATGQTFEISLTRRQMAVAPRVTARILDSGIAYLKFNNFDVNATAQIRTALEKFKVSPGLILDLRYNNGGDGEEGLRVAAFLLNQEIPVARIVTRSGKPPAPDIPMQLATGSQGGQIFSNPVIVLTNEATASTAELVTAALQENGRVRVVGTQTCGCVLAVMKYHELAGGAVLSFSEFDFVTSRGRRLEGAGVTPDKTVKLTLSDLQNERDAALAEAENQLLKFNKTSGSNFFRNRRAAIDFQDSIVSFHFE